MTDLFQKSGATISECGTYRYHLWRVWDDEKPIMVFVMLNPSTADAQQDDPTIRRCIGFARRDGFGGISVRNVFALRATNPRELIGHRDPVGPLNAEHLLAARSVSLLTKLVVAWGARLPWSGRGSALRTAYCNAANICMGHQACCLGVTKSGDPRHPLYVRGDAELVRWVQPEY